MPASENPKEIGSIRTVEHRSSGALDSLRYRDFRLIWIGFSVSAVGTWMQIVAQSLLVLDLTHGSATALGIVSLAQAISFLLFTLIGGGIADRLNRRSLLLVTQSLLMGLAIVLGILTASGAIRFWMIPVAAFLGGALLSFDQPSRNALVATLVPPQSLMNAMSLQAAVFNGASILGPALAGLSLSRIGYAGEFYCNAISYFATLIALLFLGSVPTSARPRGSLFRSVHEALQYVRRDRVLPSTITAFGALLFFGPSMAIVLPIFARQVSHIGSMQLGILFSAAGVGTVIGALIVALLGDYSRKQLLVLESIAIWIAALCVFGFSTGMPMSILALTVMGAAQSIAGAVTITLLQSRVPPEMRGRAMSLNTLLIMCIRPLGDFPVAALLGLIGFRSATLICAALVGAIVLAVSMRKRPQLSDS